MRHSPRGGRGRSRLVCMWLAVVFLAGGAASMSAADIDLVVMIDTSESMFPYFDDVTNYLIQDLLTSKLHKGDTFHLLSFSSVPEVEISLSVNSDASAQQAFGRILLLHALGRYTDLVSALQFLSMYVKELPEKNPKQIILITDGVHDPPPGSRFKTDAAAVQAAIADITSTLRKEGWTFNILKVPPQPAPGEEGRKSYLADIAQGLGVAIVPYKVNDSGNMTGRTTGFPDLIFPPGLGKVGTVFSAPFRIKNWKEEPIIVRLSSIQSDGAELLERKLSVTVPASGTAALAATIRLPLSYPAGDHQASVQLLFEDDLRISPTAGTLSFTYTGKGGLPIPRLTILYVLYIVLALGVIYLLVRLFLYMRKKLSEAPLTGIARGQAARPGHVPISQLAASPLGAGGKSVRTGGTRVQPAATRVVKRVSLMSAPSATVSPDRIRPTVTSIRRALPRQPLPQTLLPPLIEMRVDQQNHRVGFRNVHRISPGSARTVGGRFSAYLVFLVKVPASIGEIRNVDGKYTFTPLRSEMFPKISGPLEGCLNADIPFVGPRGRELVLHFREWVSPLEEINRLLRQARSHDG
jgi:hypothetical protein